MAFSSSRSLFVRSILGRKAFPGWVIVETDTFEYARSICAGVADVLGDPSQIPIEEVWSWLNTRPYLPLPGSWVRLTDHPPYAGDLGWVYSVTKSRTAHILLFPRFDRTVSYDEPRPSKKARQKGRMRHDNRPAQGLLTIEEAVRLFGEKAVLRLKDFNSDGVVHREDYYQIKLGTRWCKIFYGFLLLSTLDIESTIPSDDDLSRFCSNDNFVQLGFDPDCREAFRQLAASRLQAGHRVRVVAGELLGMTGTVQEVMDQAASVVLEDPQLGQQPVEFRILDLRAHFIPGDYVKIVYGKHFGEHGFVTEVTSQAVTIYERRKEQSLVAPVHCVNLFLEPKVISNFNAAKTSPLPRLENPLNDPLVGRRVRVILDETFKNYEGFIKRRMANDPSKIEVELAAKTAQHTASRVEIPLAHLANWDDPTFTSLADEAPKKSGRPGITPIDIPFSRQPLLPSIPVPGMSVALGSSRAPATPAWSPSAAMSSTPAWNPSSRTPGHQGTSDTSDVSVFFPCNPYITSVLLPDDLRIKVVIHNSHPRPGKRGWRGGQMEGSQAVWRKGDHGEAGMAKVTINDHQTLTLPEEYIRPYHPDQKGTVIVIDPRHPKYCQEFVIMSFKDSKTQCIVRAKDDHSRARPKDHPNASNRFTLPVTSLAVILQ
ncbi:hypothetical protein H0H92_007518 [Tricholoma furcatifolium]|nr:hypothetical protein H0H92_007518 [Tricholoma furcatifolium]